MHYEPFCELCGVSFAIARLRRVDEPEGAGWDSAGLNYILAYDSDSGLDVSALCEEGSGCRVFDRGGGRTEEHLAGPGCVAYSGYSGHRISLAEMKGCRAVQCLVKKTASWMPEDDDQDFEIEGDYFLSGIRDDLPYTTPQLEFMESSRHGVQFLAMSYIETDSEDALPFHPTCFEIYKAFCMMRIGRVDTKMLIYSRLLASDNWMLTTNDPAVLRGINTAHDQWWTHEPGSEYLVANPIEVPGLSQLLESLVNSNCKKVIFGNAKGCDDSQTQGHRTSPPISKSIQDPFSQLSAEITSMILAYLGSKDIATLRLATPVFRQLPTILFRRLLLEDMPWLFEVKNLDVAKINWYDCYCASKAGCRDLKGLRNRRRIWQGFEELIRRTQIQGSEEAGGAH